MQLLAGRKFHFKPLLTVCVVLALGVLIALGNWQLHRLEWKQDLVAKVEARVGADPIAFEEAVRRARLGEDMEYTPVVLEGWVDASREARVFGSYDARAGAYIFAPVTRSAQTPEGALVYVNFGFAPQQRAPEELTYASDRAPQITMGLLRYAERPTPPASWFRPQGQTADGLWYVRDPAKFAVASNAVVSPYYVDQSAVADRQWPKAGTTRLAFNNRHLDYALTWYGLALTLVGVWVVFSFRKPTREAEGADQA